MSLLGVALDPATVIVAVDPGKVSNRVWVSDGSGLLTDPVSLPVAREGIRRLDRLFAEHAAVDPVIAVEATGSLHRSWVAEMERRRPGVGAVVRAVGDQGSPNAVGLRQIQD